MSVNNRKRILEIDEGKFVAQVYEITAGWAGISKDNETWAKRDNVKSYCICNTLQDANDRLQNYLDHNVDRRNKEKQQNKIHKITTVPKVWRVLRSKK